MNFIGIAVGGSGILPRYLRILNRLVIRHQYWRTIGRLSAAGGLDVVLKSVLVDGRFVVFNPHPIFGSFVGRYGMAPFNLGKETFVKLRMDRIRGIIFHHDVNI
jgi:hypothetical protein